jgi:RNA polymerase sigma-70 factor (ECF subfamily)
VNQTSVSLLDRLRGAGPDASDWGRLQSIYRPLIERWIRRIPGLEQAADDVTQEVLAVVAREIPRFQRQREGSFRAWLRQVTVNQVRSFRRRDGRFPRAAADPAEGFLDNLADPRNDLALAWDREHDQHLVDRLLTLVRPDFQATTWDAFQRFALDGEPARQVAESLGLSENAVLLAKSRVLRRLRQEAGELLG